MPGGNKKVLKAAGLFKYVWPFCYHQALKGWNAILGVSSIKNLRNFTLRDLPFMCCGWNVHRSTVPRNLPCPKRILVKTLCNILKQWSIQFHKDLFIISFDTNLETSSFRADKSLYPKFGDILEKSVPLFNLLKYITK